MPWWTWALFCYCLVAGALLMILLPIEKHERLSLMAFCILWPLWALLIIVEAAEEARRSIINDRVE
jgi:O-antigen ligase